MTFVDDEKESAEVQQINQKCLRCTTGKYQCNVCANDWLECTQIHKQFVPPLRLAKDLSVVL